MSLSNLRNRFFQSYFRVTRPMTMGVRGLVVNEAREICLVRHTYVKGWYMPGGGIEKGETAEYALERELEEEAGIEMTGRPNLLGVFSNHDSFPNDHVLLYEVRDWRHVAATSEGEIADHGFFSLDDLPDTITSGTKLRLQQWAEGVPPSRYWGR